MSILKSLNIEREEFLAVSLLISQSVFLGMFYGTFDIGAHTMFLKTYPESMIPKAYMISGVLGIVLTSIYSKLQAKLKFSRLAQYNFMFIAIVTAILWLYFQFSNSNVAVFLSFILLGPLNILAIIAFWGTISRIFNLRQGKRLFGIIDTGQVIGIIISSYAVPLIITIFSGTKDLFLVSALSIFGAMVLEVVISRKFSLDVTTTTIGNKTTEDINEQATFKDFVKNRYIKFMALFVVFSMFTAFFVQYSFLCVTNEQYPEEAELAKYLGFFTGSMMIFTLLIKTFVYGKLIKTYGLKVSLLLSSVLILLFTGLAILSGLVSGYTVASAGFVYFFLFISLSKLFNKTIKDAIEVPSFKLLYQSLNKKIRFDIQARMDGTVNEISALISGIMLSILSLLSFIHLIHYSVVLFIILLVWVYITVNLYKEYRNSLEQALKTGYTGITQKTDIIFDKKNIDDSKNANSFLNNIKHISPLNYLHSLQQYINLNESDNSLIDNLKNHLTYIYCLYYSKKLSVINNKKIESILSKNKTNNDISVRECAKLIKSGAIADILLACNYITQIDNKHRGAYLSSLMRTPDLEVQKTAICLAGSLREPELCNVIIESVQSKTLMVDSIIALNQLSENCMPIIIQAFYKTDIQMVAQLVIIDIAGKNRSQQSIEFLLENLSNHRSEIFLQSVLALKDAGFAADEKNRHRMFHPITQVAETIAWDISALASLGEQYSEHLLERALKAEYAKHSNLLIDLLSLTYDAKSVQHVNDYLESGSAEGISYALELFDMFISEEIKPQIVPLFEDIPHADKTLILQNFYPVTLYPTKELIINILNRDPNLISKLTKLLAINEYNKHYTIITDDLAAQLFSPVAELQVESARVIKNMNQKYFNTLTKRLKPADIKLLNRELTQQQQPFLQVFPNKLAHKCNNYIDIWESLKPFNPENSKNSYDSEKYPNYFVLLKVVHIIDNDKSEIDPDNFELSMLWHEQSFNNNMFDEQNNFANYIISYEQMRKIILTDKKFTDYLISLS